jgi:ATP adenylyltransferase
MDHLWTPWRYAYLANTNPNERKGVPEELDAWPGDTGCVFCNLLAATDYAIEHGMPRAQAEKAGGIVYRAKTTFVCLNRFPYTSGHILILPYAHEASFAALPSETAAEIAAMAQASERVLGGVYAPDGFNFGMNLGAAAGAGVAGHLHLHFLPRWTGDANFMTAVAETRVLPETLETTWERLRAGFQELMSETGA